MQELLESIRAATAPDASEQTKAAGAAACRTLLTVLEAKEGQPLATSPTPAGALEAAAMVLRGISPDQLLDLAIARLKAALPPGTSVQASRALMVPMVSIPPGKRR